LAKTVALTVFNAEIDTFAAPQVIVPATSPVCDVIVTSPGAVNVPSTFCPAQIVSVVPTVVVTAEVTFCSACKSTAWLEVGWRRKCLG